ncbi:ligand-binding sensor domain-containing protein [Cyclobacterium jeungdonense]|uniref:Two-component regulator propeller domain-containing protein n=1 Tax=Cyclobacterium jeungdonense TaxID=708087 RepID=A0ABT8C3B7_9BACT|nr:sensor histidine kinase [Cyclobacterium jeungdonense]MDN3687259.1 two-component regulator propeller domain-containing protein [Cyclobacterium jeungdonense]
MKKSFFILLLLFNCLNIQAEAKRFFINRFGLAEGLSANQVLTIHQDRDRFLWIGTPNGLQRFDGRKFMTYEVKINGVKQPSLPVYEIQQDRSGKMWLKVGEQYGVYIPELEQFTPFPFEKPQVNVRGESFWMDRKGQVFVIFKEDKILRVDLEKGHITDKNVPIKLPEGWRPRSVFEDRLGRYWLSCIEGIAVYDPANGEVFTPTYNPENLPVLQRPGIKQVINLYEDQQGIFWINYWDVDEILLSYDPKTRRWKDHMQELRPGNNNYQEAFGLLELPDGQLWRYGIQTLADFDRKNHRFTRLVQNDMLFDIISKAIWDPSKGIWLGTDQGLYFLHLETPNIFFRKFDTQEGNHELQSVKEIIHRGDTSVWLGSWGKGIKIFKPQGEQDSDWTRKNLPAEVTFRQVWDLFHDRKREVVWVALQQGNLQIIDLNTQKSVFLSPEAFEGSTIRTIAQDAKGDLFFGTQRGAIIHYSGGAIQKEGFRLFRKVGGTIPKLLVSNDQKIWAATLNEGVYVFDPENGQIIQHLDERILSSNKIGKIHQLNDSIFLMGYELLNKYNVLTGKNQVFSYSDGMVSNVISHIESDETGLVWINTPNGMTRFDALNNTFSSFGKNHFLSQLPTDGYSGTRLIGGELAFVSNNSLLLFDPMQFERNLAPPRPVITGVSLFGVYVGDGTVENPQRVFSSHQNNLTFDFNLLNFPIQDRFAYYYRLVGADPEWVKAKGDFQAVYSLLPPGAYRFEVKTANELGVFSEPSVYSFEIKPSLVQTWWFKALLGMLFLGIVVLIYRMNVNRILAVVKLRSQLARDLHDDMGSTLSTINILSSMAKTKLGTDPAKTSEYISKISENSQRMMESMDDIVWSIKPQNDSMEKLIARMREFANQVLESKDIAFSMEVDECILGMKLSMDARRDLFLIFKEGINNAAKYSGAERVFISFGLDKDLFTMRIEDYGKGFDLENLDEGNGLGNMKKRSANLGGNLEIKTNPGNGTVLELKVHL